MRSVILAAVRRFRQRRSLKPFTIVRDWDEDISDEIRVDDDPQIFHVWAANGSDASDEAEREAADRFGAAAYYLHPVAVLQGHSPFAED